MREVVYHLLVGQGWNVCLPDRAAAVSAGNSMSNPNCLCPHCGEHIEFDLENVGIVAPCPKCGKVTTLTASVDAPPVLVVCSVSYTHL